MQLAQQPNQNSHNCIFLGVHCSQWARTTFALFFFGVLYSIDTRQLKNPDILGRGGGGVFYYIFKNFLTGAVEAPQHCS